MSQPQSPAPSPPEAKRRRGCLFYGCFGTIVLVGVFLVAGYLGFRYAVARYTDTKPLPLPKTQFSVEQFQRLNARIVKFRSAVEDNRPADALILAADEVNALIQTDPDWAFLKDALYVGFEGDRLNAQISIPIERLRASIRLRGRYLNAAGTFTVALRGGLLEVNAQSLLAKGRPVPESVMQHLRSRNSALTFTNALANVALSRLQDVRIQDGKLVIVPKPVR